MRPLRVLHLMSCRGFSSDAYWAGRIACELTGRGHRVTLVARAGTEQKVLRRLADLGVSDVRTLGFSGRRSPGGVVRDLRQIRRWIAEHDVVHAHRGKEHWLAAWANALGGGPAPLVRTRHIVAPVANHAAHRWLYRHATAHVVAVSTAIREGYLASGLLTADRVTALPGGVDAARFRPGIDGRPVRAALGLPAEAPVVGVLGGLRAMKGHAVLVEAARTLRGRHPGVRFLIVGDGYEAQSLRQLVAAAGLEEIVVLAGAVPAPEQAIAAFDVAVHPSLASEGMGRVVFEYMAAGGAIVATRVGLAPEVLEDGKTALLVPPGDAGALAVAIGTLLDDRPLGAALGRAARALVEARYAGARVAEAVEGVYRAALRRAGREPA